MKKKLLLSILLFCVLNVNAQKEINTSFANQMNTIFSDLDKTKIPHGILLDYGMEFTDVTAYNGILSDSVWVNSSSLREIYNTLLSSRIIDQRNGFVTPQEFSQNWQTQRSRDHIALSGFYFKYSKFSDDITPEKLNYSEEKIWDKYINGVWQNPYQEMQTFAIASPINIYKNLSVNVKIPSSIFYSNYLDLIQNIEFDFGRGYVEIPFDQLVNINYTTEGIKIWKFKLNLTNGEVLYCQSKIKIEKGLETVAFDTKIYNNNSCSLYYQNITSSYSYKGEISYVKKNFWVIKKTIEITYVEKNQTNGILPIDSYGDGFFSIGETIDLNEKGVNLFRDKFNFIPTTSALDVGRGYVTLNDFDFQNKYVGANPPSGVKNSPFDNFYTDFDKNNPNSHNQRHISFNKRNGNWLANELNNTNSNTSNCSYICTAEITGNDILCDTSTFSVPKGALYYNWSITQGSNLVQSFSGNQTNEFTLNGKGANGIIKIQVTFGDYNQYCGNVTLTKEIKTGNKPYFVEKIPIGEQNGYNLDEPNISFIEDGSACNMVRFQVIFNSFLPILEYELENTTTQVSCFHTGGGIFNLNSACNKLFTGKIRARNACDWSDWKYIEHYIDRCTEDCLPPPNYTIGANFKISPNPVNNGFMTITVNQVAPSTVYLSEDTNPNDYIFDYGNGNEPIGVTNFNPIVNINMFNLQGILVLSFPNTQLQATLDI